MKMNRKILSWIAGTLSVVAVLTPGAISRQTQSALALSVRHDHAWGSCSGTLTLDGRGVRYETKHTKDAREWTYGDVQQFQVEEGRRLRILTYEDRKWRLGADKMFEFDWQENQATPEEVYQFIQARVRRPIAAWLRITDLGAARFQFPVKHLGIVKGTEGRLVFTDRWVVLQSEEKEEEKNGNRTWRYDDIESISSSGPYELTLTTYERARLHYASRRVYRFQLKEPLPTETYDALWRFVNEKKGRQ